jgi:hypothetical protein
MMNRNSDAFQGFIFSLVYLKVIAISCIALFLACAVSYLRTANKPGLRSVPGPRLARYSNLWRLRNAVSGLAPQNFQKVHKTYGKVVRTGPNHISISDPSMIPVIYGISSKYLKVCFLNSYTY